VPKLTLFFYFFFFRDFESAFCSLKQAVAADLSPPITPQVKHSKEVILLDDSDTPVFNRNSADRKVVIKVRTSSGIKKFNMKAVSFDLINVVSHIITRDIPRENICLGFLYMDKTNHIYVFGGELSLVKGKEKSLKNSVFKFYSFFMIKAI
jgi:hypothetical protein